MCIFSLNKGKVVCCFSFLQGNTAYPVDPGLINAYAIHPNTKLSQSLETAVFRSLREKSDSIHYYMTQQGWEVDFIVQTPEGQMELYQVSLSIKDKDTYEREVRALSQAMKEIGIKCGTIVTLEEEAEISVSEGTILVIPVWKFLLR